MRRLALLPLVLAATAAGAASLDIKGTYGNAAGCKYAADGEYGDETVVMLTAETYETFVMFCDFAQVLPMKNGSSVVTMVCGHEGEDYQTIEFMRVAKVEGGAYATYSSQGDLWETVRPCGEKHGGGR